MVTPWTPLAAMGQVMEQSFALVNNTARESRLLMLFVGWIVILPVMGLVFWRVRLALGPTAASIAGGICGVLAIGLIIFWYSRREHYTLTVSPSSITVVDSRGKEVESLALGDTEVVLAAHQYLGRVPMRLPVLVLREHARVITVGANAWAEPGVTRNVAAARFLIEPQDLPRLKATVESSQRRGR